MVIGRRLKTFGARFALGALLVTGTAATTGCGMLNLKAAWAVAEPAPMQAVVRRADAARAVALNVERLMSATGVDDDSKWVTKVAIKKADVEPLLKEISGDPEYMAPKGVKLRIVHAEAWASMLSGLCSTESKAPSLWATMSPEVHAGYADIANQSKEVAKIKGEIAAEEAALDDKEKAGEKAEHEAKKKELKEKLDKTEAEYKPKIEAFRKKVGEEAAKASPEAKKQMAAAIAALKLAIDDAKVANAASFLGYPKAFPGLKDEVKNIVKRIAADAIEEKIGTRPNLEKLVPEVKLSGGVSVTIAGLDPSDIGKLDMAGLVKDIAERAKNYVVHIVTLIPYIKETDDLLSLQADLLDDAQKAIAGDDKAGGAESLADLAVTAEGIADANKGGGAGGTGKGKRHMIKMEFCKEEKKAEAPAAEPPAAKKDDGPAPKDPDEVDPKKKGKGGKKAPPPPPAKKKGK